MGYRLLGAFGSVGRWKFVSFFNEDDGEFRAVSGDVLDFFHSGRFGGVLVKLVGEVIQIKRGVDHLPLVADCNGTAKGVLIEI